MPFTEGDSGPQDYTLSFQVDTPTGPLSVEMKLQPGSSGPYDEAIDLDAAFQGLVDYIAAYPDLVFSSALKTRITGYTVTPTEE